MTISANFANTYVFCFFWSKAWSIYWNGIINTETTGLILKNHDWRRSFKCTWYYLPLRQQVTIVEFVHHAGSPRPRLPRRLLGFLVFAITFGMWECWGSIFWKKLFLHYAAKHTMNLPQPVPSLEYSVTFLGGGSDTDTGFVSKITFLFHCWTDRGSLPLLAVKSTKKWSNTIHSQPFKSSSPNTISSGKTKQMLSWYFVQK